MILEREIMDIFARHEQEDYELVNYQMETIIQRDFEEGERILAEYRNDRKQTWSGGVPTRTEHQFSVRKHTVASGFYLHTHNFYELIIVLEGSCIHYLDDRMKPMELRAGTAFLLMPGIAHGMEAAREQDFILKIRIPIPLFRSVCQELPEAVLPDRMKDGTYRQHIGTERYETVLKLLLQEVFGQNAYREGMVKSCLVLLFGEMLQQEERQEKRKLLQQVVSYIEQNTATADLRTFAAEAGYSTGHISRQLKRQSNQNFRELVQSIRLKKAVEELTATDEPVEQIALQLGYRSAAGLYKNFTRAYGMTPGEYRHMIRGV